MVLACTGLGFVNRGFEQYISSLAESLSASDAGKALHINVWAGGNWQGKQIHAQTIWNIPRHHLQKLCNPTTAFLWEQRTFFLGMVWKMIWGPVPNLFYLGEYRLYCYLFKFRKLFRLRFKLCLYTGAYAIPGKNNFHSELDFIHHINLPLFKKATYLPAHRQMLLPHFLNFDFGFDEDLFNKIKKRAGEKKIILYVGAIQKNYKRADVLVLALQACKVSVFPVFAGKVAQDFPEFGNCMINHWGDEGFFQASFSREQLGTLYRAADVLVHPGISEIFGLVYIEALYFGLPVLTSRHEQSEYVLGLHGQWVNCDTVQQLADDIDAYFLKEPEDEFASEKMHSFAINRYSWPQLQKAYIDLFEHASK